VLPNLTHECVLELLKLSSNVNECNPLPSSRLRSATWQGLTLVHFSAQPEPFLKQKHTLNTP